MKNSSKRFRVAKKVIAAGHFCLDILPDLNNVPAGQFFQLFQPGHLLETGPMQVATGGAASNTGISLTKLGVPTSIIARLGNDGFGRMAVTHLEKFVMPGFNQLRLMEGETTSYTVIINPPGVDRIFLHHPGANDMFTVEDIDFTGLSDHILFHYGYPQLMKQMYIDEGENLLALFEKAKAVGFTTSLDTTFPDPSSAMGRADWDGILKKALPYVDIFNPSFEEAFFMLDRKGYEDFDESKIHPDKALELTEKILDYGAQIAFLKLGQAGAVLHTRQLDKNTFGRAWFPGLEFWQNQILYIPSFHVNVVGTTGAGDSTIAGFLAAILREKTAGEALQIAMGVGACNVEAFDSVSGVRCWEETLERIENGWEQNPVSFALAGWKKSTESQLWEREN